MSTAPTALAAPARRTPAKPIAAAVTLTFDNSCKIGTRATIAAVGDLLFHDALQAQALRAGRTFREFWSPVADVLSSADLTYGNLESPIAAGVSPGGRVHKDPGRVLDKVVYGRRGDGLVFNTHPSVAADLVASGFDVVSTANNHAADRGALGIDRTLDALAAAGLAASGSRRSTERCAMASDASGGRAAAGEACGRSRATQTKTATGVNVAWLACTYGLNGMPDQHGQVLNCYRDREVVIDTLRGLASDPAIDAVMFTPHWGAEGAPNALVADRAYARAAIDAGATAVIGAHPHVLQPWEKHVTADGREGLIIYSTGNFISNQQSNDQRTGVIALLEVTKPDDGSAARLSGAGFIATFVTKSSDSGHRVTPLTGANASVGRLPGGNRVTVATRRNMPRSCLPRSAPVVMAAAPADASGGTPAVSAMATAASERVDQAVGGSSRLEAPTQGSLDTIKVATADDRATVAPEAEHGHARLRAAPVRHVARTGETVQQSYPIKHPAPDMPSDRQNPVATLPRMWSDRRVSAVPLDLVGWRLLWHEPSRVVLRQKALWIAPLPVPANLPWRPSQSPLGCCCSKSAHTMRRIA